MREEIRYEYPRVHEEIEKRRNGDQEMCNEEDCSHDYPALTDIP